MKANKTTKIQDKTKKFEDIENLPSEEELVEEPDIEELEDEPSEIELESLPDEDSTEEVQEEKTLETESELPEPIILKCSKCGEEVIEEPICPVCGTPLKLVNTKGCFIGFHI